MAEITNKLLKQAIADAEAVRETAVANAKLVLEEAITPQIRDMIARRLRVESEMGEEEKEKEVEGGEEKKEVPTAPAAPTAPKTEATKELPFQDAEPVGGPGPEDTSTIGTGDNKQPSPASFDSSDIDQSGEGETDSETGWYDDWSESDFDLESVIKELEEDIAALANKEEDDDKGEYPKSEPAGEEGAEAPADSSKIGLKKEMDQEPEVPEAPAAGKEGEEDDLDLEEILAELEAEEDEMGKPEMAGHDDKTKEMAAELARLKSEMAQYREAVDILRGRLQEVNLLNAKLLFTNKMFKKEGLTNEQKVRIVESFDRATTVREVKLVYTALVENLSTAAKTFSASRKKVVTEGFASKATPSTAPKAEVIVENTVAKRLQELAGII
jgi:hypothetical protein